MAVKSKSKKSRRFRQGKKRAKAKKSAPIAKTVEQKIKKIPTPKIVHKTRNMIRVTKKTAKRKTKKKPTAIKRPRKKARSKRYKNILLSYVRLIKKKRSDSAKKGVETKRAKLRVLGARPAKQAPKIAPVVTTRKFKSGSIKSITFPVPFENLEQWLRDLIENPTLDGLIPENAKLGFRYYGNNSLHVHSSVKDAVNTFQFYETTIKAIYDEPEKGPDVYKNVEFVLVEGTVNWETARETYNKKYRKYRKNRKRKRSEYSSSYWHRLSERYPGKYQAILAVKRARAKARYERIKNDPSYRERKKAYDKALRKTRRKSKANRNN